MQYITARQAAENWNLTVRRIQDLCRNQQIDGVVRWGRDWMIPADAHRPDDRRRKAVTYTAETVAQLPRKNPVIIMSNIYNTPGTADQVAESLSDRPAAQSLFRAQVDFCRGELEASVRRLETLLKKPCGHDLQIGCGMMLCVCAITAGSEDLWKKGINCIKTAPCHSNRDRYAVDFWLGAAECELRETNTFPLWFARGIFDVLPGDSFPGARFYYLRYLYLMGHQYAVGQLGALDAQIRTRLFPCVAEPLIAQNRKEGALVSEIYTRLVLATSYHDMGDDAMATRHLDIAIRLALPDKLYMPLAEYRRQLDFLMDERLQAIDPSAIAPVRALNRRFLEGFTYMHNHIHGRTISNELSTREREVAKHAAFGLSNKEIAQRLHISVNTVKQSLRAAMDKTGAIRRSDLAGYL